MKRYLLMIFVLWPTWVSAQNYTQTIDANNNPVTGFELFVGGVETIGKQLNVGFIPGVSSTTFPGGVVSVFNAGGTGRCYGGPNDGAACSTNLPTNCTSGFCVVTAGLVSAGQIQINGDVSPIDAFTGVRAYTVSGSSNITEAVCNEFGYNYLYYSTPDDRWKKCSAGTLSDLDTTDLTLLDTCAKTYANLNPTLGDEETSGFCGKVVFSQYPTLNYPIVTGGIYTLANPVIQPSDCVPNLYNVYVDGDGRWKKCMNGVLSDLAGSEQFTFTLREFEPTAPPIPDTSDVPSIYPNRSDAFTITEVCCEIDTGTTTINLQRDDGFPANILASDLVCNPVIANGCTTVFNPGEASIATGNNIDFVLVTNSAAKRINVVVKYTIP